jgi:hypothetical protein
MRFVFLTAAVAALMLFDLRAGQAFYQGYYYDYYYGGPWCAVQSLGFSTVKEDCSMRDFEQCRMETIAGNRGYCIPNPRWPGTYGFAGQPRRTPNRRVRRH